MESNYVRNKLEQIKREGYGLHLEAVLSNAFDIHKKSILPGFVATFIYMVVIIIVGLSMFETTYGMGLSDFFEMIQRNPEAMETTMANIPMTSMLISYLVSGLAGALIMPMLSGIYKVAFNTKYGGNGSVSDLFAYYKGSYFLNIFIYSFLFSVLVQLINLGLEKALPGIGSLLGILVMILLSVTFIFTIPFIVFGNLNWIEALKASVAVTSKNWFFLFFILVISFIISFIGVIFCGVGFLFTMPFLYIATFVLYDTIIGFQGTEDIISKIGEE